MLRALDRAAGSLTAAQVAQRLGITPVRATGVLRRLAEEGHVQVTAVRGRGASRATEITLHYQTRPAARLAWPEWLDPRRLPQVCVPRRISRADPEEAHA